MRRSFVPALLLLVALPLPVRAQAPAARMDPRLVSASGSLSAFVHAPTTDAAEDAARDVGLQVVQRFEGVGVVVVNGDAARVRAAARRPKVTYVEDAEVPISLLLDRSGKATRNTEAQQVIRTRDGRLVSGRGVSVAVVDGGVDGTHPFFALDGKSKVVANLKDVCSDPVFLLAPSTADDCFAPVPTGDSDTPSLGGHGTHVAGIAAGVPTVISQSGAQRKATGAAPGASLVALSVGVSLSIRGGALGLNWVLQHHLAPCGSGRSAASCPPIRVVNNSWGPVGGSAFSPDSAVVKLQRALVREGVVVVWAAGNDGGDGSGKDPETQGLKAQLTNGPGNDPTPGVLMVAAYDASGGGARDAGLASFSSRGVKGSPGTYPDLSAPGVAVTSSCRPTLEICSEGLDPWDGPAATDVATFNTISGTSMAAPYVAGAVAELLELDPALSPAAVERVLEDGAYRFGSGYETDPANGGSLTSFDKGHGLLDVLASADLVQGRKGRPAPPAAACGALAWTDARGDATRAYQLVATGKNHPEADLLQGRWEWDGAGLTAVFGIDDLSPAGRTPDNKGTYVNISLRLGSDPRSVTLAGKTDGNGRFYASDSDETTTALPTLAGSVLDRAGAGSDEIRIVLTDAALTALGPGYPRLVDGLVVTTLNVTGAYTNPATFVSLDSAVGGCPVTLG